MHCRQSSDSILFLLCCPIRILALGALVFGGLSVVLRPHRTCGVGVGDAIQDLTSWEDSRGVGGKAVLEWDLYSPSGYTVFKSQHF